VEEGIANSNLLARGEKEGDEIQIVEEKKPVSANINKQGHMCVKPKRVLTGYMAYVKLFRTTLMKEQPLLSFKETSQKLGDGWKNIGAEQKAVVDAEVRRDHERFEKETAAFERWLKDSKTTAKKEAVKAKKGRQSVLESAPKAAPQSVNPLLSQTQQILMMYQQATNMVTQAQATNNPALLNQGLLIMNQLAPLQQTMQLQLAQQIQPAHLPSLFQQPALYQQPSLFHQPQIQMHHLPQMPQIQQPLVKRKSGYDIFEKYFMKELKKNTYQHLSDHQMRQFALQEWHKYPAEKKKIYDQMSAEKNRKREQNMQAVLLAQQGKR